MRSRTLLALLLVVPLVDALFLIYVATRLGWAVTVALVVLTAILGMLLLRAEGRATLARVQRKLARGEPPTNELLDGGLLIAAGALLLTPGLVTDGIGFLFAFPLTRVPIRTVIKKYVVVPYIDRETSGFATGNVYIGGFPSGDEGFDEFGGGFGPGGPGSGGPGPGASGPGGPSSGGFDSGGSESDEPDPDGPFGSGRQGGAGGHGPPNDASSGSDGSTDDVVDVDFTVEDDEDERGS